MFPSYEYFYNYSQNVTDVESLNGLFLDLVGKYGFDRMVLSLQTDHNDYGLKAKIGITHNISKEWMKTYHENNLIEIDPVQRFARTKSETFKWSDVATEMLLTPKQKRFMKQLEKTPLHNGYFVPLWGPNTFAGVALASSVRHEEHHVDPSMLSTFSRHYYECFLKLHKKNINESLILPENEEMGPKPLIALKQREVQILHMAARGLKDAEIAQMLEISPHTIDAHFRNIYKKLNTNTRAAAVALALSQHLIWI